MDDVFMQYGIDTHLMKLGEMNFEVDVCGDLSSEKLALFLHGFPETSYAWRHQMPRIAELGYKCWAPNQRGYGNTSSPQDLKSYSMHTILGDVVKLIDASQCKSITLIGHDWGGVVAWQFALHHTRPVEKLVILNTPHPAIIEEELKKFRQLKKMWYAFLFLIPKLPEYLLTRNNAEAIESLFHKTFINKGNLSQEAIEIYKQNALRPGGMTAMLNWYRSNFCHLPCNGKDKIIEIPTLMVWGEKDAVLGIDCALGTEKYVKDFTIRYLPDTGHFVNEEEPKQINEIVSAWLQGKPVPGSDSPKKRDL